MKNIHKIGKELYIISDEEIKEGDWYLNNGHLLKCTELKIRSSCKKIILTTDQDLIKEGVQSIDDEFLEWFVKNPSCEWVEVEDVYKKFLNGDKRSVSDFRNKYKIIIAKEEPKQETLEEAAENYSGYEEHRMDFIEGAKWQQEKIYNEIKELHDSEDITGFSQWTLAKCLDIIKNK